MNYKEYFKFYIMEAQMPVREPKKIPELVKINYDRLKRNIKNLFRLRDKMVNDEDWESFEYYLKQTFEQNIIESINELFSNNNYNSIENSVNDIIKISNAAKDEKNGWKWSELLNHYLYSINRIYNTKEQIFRYFNHEFWSEDMNNIKNRYLNEDFWSENIHNYLKELLKIYYMFLTFYDTIEKYKKALETYNNLFHDTNWERTRPIDLEEIETAYHASINARSIYENGFKLNFSQSSGSNKGIGGGNIENGISFTLDLYHARGIAKTLKTCWLIANKKYNIRDIIEQIKHFPRKNKEETYSVENIKRQFKYGEGNGKDMPENEYELLKFYIYSLYFTETYNPIFAFMDKIEFTDHLKKIKYSDIGILKCKIKTTGEHTEYLRSMEEMRVRPEDVVSIDQLIQ